MTRKYSFVLIAFLVAGPTQSALGQEHSAPAQKDLGGLDLEELMKVQVVTASKEAESLSQVAGAVYVVTREQIRRSGATSVPEALRGVPGVQVQRLSPSVWSVGIRGMGGRFSNKLLVLMDGRTVYTPTFSGVYWDAQDIDLALVDRIEVIRGPGGTLWGSNAVNGIINIITKDAADTKGNTANIESSTSAPYSVNVTHGGLLSNGAYRINAGAFRENSLDSSLGTSADNRWDGLKGGARGDWGSGKDRFSVSGLASSSHEGSLLRFPTLTAPYSQISDDRFTTSEYSFVAKWERISGADRGMSLQTSFDHYDRDLPEAGDRRSTFDLDFQKPLQLSSTNHLMWGLGYNITSSHDVSSPYISLSPLGRTSTLWSAFVLDEAQLSKRTKLSLGTKLEHNDFSGWEFQPSIRLTYAQTNDQTWWGAVSRAVRIPSIGETDTSTFLAGEPGPGGLPVMLKLVGNLDYDAESVVSTEMGWRYSPSSKWFLDAATFYSHYEGLRGGALLTPSFVAGPSPYILQPVQEGNDYSATTGGLELAGHWAVRPNWHLDGSYTLYTESYHLSSPNGGALGSGAAGDGLSPRHQFSLRSQLDLSPDFEFDVNGSYVGALPGPPQTAAYAQLDLRLGWKPSRAAEYSLGVLDLTNQSHLEGVDTPFALASQIRRSWYAKVTLRF